MPRASSSAKRTGTQGGAHNNRDTRHENGLVGPGKRISKQKSQGQLGADNSKAPTDKAQCPPPTPPIPPATSDGLARHNEDMAPENKAMDGLRRSSLGASSLSSSTDSLAYPVPPAPALPQGLHQHHHHHHQNHQQHNHTVDDSGHRRIDVNDAKNNNVHRDPGPLEMAFTVLRSCPLHDTLAILIILMQVSPVALTTIYMLFTFLTFVPPVTTSSGLSITEIFDNQGTPSLATLLGMDVVVFFAWLFLWGPLQQFITDLAQVVISLTLGGGGSSRQGTTNNIFLCVAIVGASQWTRHIRWSVMSPLKRIVGLGLPEPDPAGSLKFTSGIFEKKGPYGWISSVLAVHILTQGLVRYIREWYLRREKRDLQAQTQADPEAAKLGPISEEGGLGSAEDGMEAASLPPQLGPVALSSKKRRKQSAQVRIRQPLWAALASTKIVMVKEYELSHAASESAGSNATDIHNLGNAPFNTQPEQIWICYVGCDEVCFNTSYFPPNADHGSNYDGENGDGGEIRKPFYVRVNNAIWQPTRIMPAGPVNGSDGPGTTWTGDIYGLTPLSNYECEFVSSYTGEVIFSTRVRTLEAKTKDTESHSKAVNNHPPRANARHDSPETTMRASITTANAKLAEEKARLKLARRDHNRKMNAAKKEIERLNSSVQSAGGNDEKLRQKVAQNNIQQKQAEQALEELQVVLKEYETIPEDLVARYRTQQRAYTAEKEKFDGAKASFNTYKGEIEKEIKAGEDEKSALQAKRNKIASRIAKVEADHARITDANARGLGEAERRRQQREALEVEAARTEHNLSDTVHSTRAANEAKNMQIQVLAEQMRHYLSSMQADYPYEAAAPMSAAAHAAATYTSSVWNQSSANAYQQSSSMWQPAPSTLSTAAYPQSNQFAPSPFHPLQTHTTTHHGMGTPPHIKTRGRSSSMLSDVSGFTQSTNDEFDRPFDGGGSDSVNATPGASSSQQQNQHQHPRAQFGNSLRGPPGFESPRSHQYPMPIGGGSGSGSGGSGSGGSTAPANNSAGTSVSGGSGSGGSVRDPTSPI